MPFCVFTSDEVETLARELHCRLYRTSVKEDLNVTQVFQYLAEKYLSQLDALDDYCDSQPRSITIGKIFNLRRSSLRPQLPVTCDGLVKTS